MKQLSSDWFVEGTMDFEYKKYILLAYLKQVSEEFAKYKLYPSFSDLIHHYKNLTIFQENKKKLFEQFPAHLSEEEFLKMKLAFDPEVEDSPDLQEIESIVKYSLPVINDQLKEGKEIYELIDYHLDIEPIGITPLYKNEGYVLLRVMPQKDVKVFEYRIVFFENMEGNYHGISFQAIDTFRLSLVNTYEAIKRQLIKSYSKLPNPATFLLAAKREFPEEQSLLPIAKRKMLAYLK